MSLLSMEFPFLDCRREHMPFSERRFIIWAACVTFSLRAGLAQTPSPVVLQVDIENYVQYRGDISDTTKFATIPTPTTAPTTTFLQNVQVGDIVAVNGRPAKGLWQNRFIIMPFRQNPTPGQPIADLTSSGVVHCVWEILGTDGTYIGALMDGGTGVNHPLIGGVGAFLNITGLAVTQTLVPARVASMSEDPSMRRINGGGTARATFYLYPAERPTIQLNASGPTVFHNDFSQVTPTNPAHPGETLIVRATGLGPVGTDLTPPGVQPFSANPLKAVNSPVTVVINGSEVPAINKIGWPGETDVYRVDFQLPNGSSGPTTIQLTAAWIPGPSITIAIK
jgi:uncharacterized protein (TIGR03437 family)